MHHALEPESSQPYQDLGPVHLLHDPPNEHGKVRAAERLGVNRKTLSQAVSRGRLTPRLRGALEQERLATQRAEADDLAERVGRLEATLLDIPREWRRELQGELQPLREELASLGEEIATAPVGSTGTDSDSTLDEAFAEYVPLRIYPGLVTIEPAADDEQVDGTAWPLVAGWRKQQAEFKAGWPELAGREAELRMLELEICLVDEHGLTLPPDGVPWDRFSRRDELRRRRGRLETARRHLKRARWRRWMKWVLSLGLFGR